MMWKDSYAFHNPEVAAAMKKMTEEEKDKTYTIIDPSPEVNELIDNLVQRCQSLGEEIAILNAKLNTEAFIKEALREENEKLKSNLKTSQWFVAEMSKGIKELHAELARLQGESPDAGYNSLNLDNVKDIYKFKGCPETKLWIRKGRV